MDDDQLKQMPRTAKNPLAGLTPKQEAFCLEYLKCGNASEAYRAAYDAGDMKPATINRKAKELMDNGKITARLNVLRQPAVEAAQLTLQEHLSALASLRDKAAMAEKYEPAVKAEELRGKASGHYVDRQEVGQPGDYKRMSNDELDKVKADHQAAVDAAEGINHAKVRARATGAKKSVKAA